jgi:hypothetical protein
MSYSIIWEIIVSILKFLLGMGHWALGNSILDFGFSILD